MVIIIKLIEICCKSCKLFPHQKPNFVWELIGRSGMSRIQIDVLPVLAAHPGRSPGGHELWTQADGEEAQRVARQNRSLQSAWAAFYGVPYFPLFEEAKAYKEAQPDSFIKLSRERLLNVELYKRRMRLVIEPFLLDANKRAYEAKRRAYVHAVGLGLGVWMVHHKQARNGTCVICVTCVTCVTYFTCVTCVTAPCGWDRKQAHHAHATHVPRS